MTLICKLHGKHLFIGIYFPTRKSYCFRKGFSIERILKRNLDHHAKHPLGHRRPGFSNTGKFVVHQQLLLRILQHVLQNDCRSYQFPSSVSCCKVSKLVVFWPEKQAKRKKDTLTHINTIFQQKNRLKVNRQSLLYISTQPLDYFALPVFYQLLFTHPFGNC